MNTSFAFSRPLYVMLKPAGARCNLRCRYCYYLEKDHLYAGNDAHFMSERLLEKFIADYMQAQTTPEVLFTWHGGEALLRPIAFYQRALQLQRRYARGRQVVNSIQTNGTLLTPEWCEFLRENGFLVGISIDGPRNVHDAYRRTSADGPSFDRVMQGLQLLKDHHVEWNALAVVNNLNVGQPREFYRFFKDIGCQYLQFAPIVERIVSRDDGLTLAPGMQEGGRLTSHSITPSQWGRFLCELFDEWVVADVGSIFVQIFDATLANWVGVTPGICSLSAHCGHAAVMEHNGDVYSCDHFVFPEYRLGNLNEKTITEMVYSPQQQRFAQMKTAMLPRQCRECPFLFACHGECPKNRFLRDKYGNVGLNYLCEGYRQFFSHVTPHMNFMRRELQAGRPPANIMQALNTIHRNS
jgi:uncharacterized protein